jgi:HK97 gp10 family phage protein
VRILAGNRINFSLENNIPQIRRNMEREFERALLKSTIRVHREVTTLLSGQRTGREYKVPATNRTWFASQPHEPPASRLGHLRASYKYFVRGNGMDAIGTVGSPLEYSHFLEYGTAKMAPRPHLKPAFQNSREDIKKYFRELME